MSTWMLVLGAIAMIALIVWAVRLGSKSAQARSEREKVDAFEDEMERIERANTARDRAIRDARAGKLPIDDPNNRDTWGV